MKTYIEINTIKPILENFDKLSPIEQYKYIENTRSMLREVQKISYRVAMFDRKFPFAHSKEENYKELLLVYLKFLIEIQTLSKNIYEDILQ